MSTPPERDDAPPRGAGPQSPGGPQSPNGPQSPPAPQSPAPSAGPQSPPAPQSPAAPQGPPGPHSPGGVQSPATGGYTGPVPAGGWQQPATPASGALAAWGPRLAATLIDGVMWFIVTFLIGIVISVAAGVGTVATGAQGVATAGGFLNLLISFALYAAYTGFLMIRPGATNGQTLGKQLLGIRVVRTDGRPVTLGTVAVRHWLMKYVVFGIIAAITLYLLTLLNYLWPLWDKQNRAFHDMAASTRVVRA